MCGLPKFSVDTYEYLSGNKLENSEKLIEIDALFFDTGQSILLKNDQIEF